MIEAIAIGSSTGGAAALARLLPQLRGLSQTIFITQHINPEFTEILAQQLARQSGVPCSEAIEGEIIRPGHAYLAPCDQHLTLQRFGHDIRITLDHAEAEQHCRPAVDPMLRSLASAFGSGLLAVILTGMGADGAAGGAAVKQAGGTIIVQAVTDSVARGMPEAVIEAGLADAVLPLEEIGAYLRRLCEQPKQQAA